MDEDTITWQKCAAVTTGGKPHFWVAHLGSRVMGWVVWDRRVLAWSATVADPHTRLLAYVSTDKEAQELVEKETRKKLGRST